MSVSPDHEEFYCAVSVHSIRGRQYPIHIIENASIFPNVTNNDLELILFSMYINLLYMTFSMQQNHQTQTFPDKSVMIYLIAL